MLRPLELRIGGEDAVRLDGGLFQEHRIDVGHVDDAQLVLLTTLSFPEELARATDLEIALRGVEAIERYVRAWLHPRHGCQPLGFAGRLADEDAERALPATTDAAAQLMQLREPEALGAEDDHHGRVRDVDADLHDRGRDEHVELARRESPHDVVALARRHAPVQQADAHAGKLLRLEITERRLGARDVLLRILLDPRRPPSPTARPSAAPRAGAPRCGWTDGQTASRRGSRRRDRGTPSATASAGSASPSSAAGVGRRPSRGRSRAAARRSDAARPRSRGPGS